MLRDTVLNKKSISKLFSLFAKKCIEHGIKDRIYFYVVGGASIIMNFSFRESTQDIDAYYVKDETINQIIADIANEMEISKKWINDDFINTPSYSKKIFEVAKIYSIYRRILYVYTLHPKYLIAMKLKSSRATGGDHDDIIKMIFELKLSGSKLTFNEVMEAYDYLYDNDHSYTHDYFFKDTQKAFDMSVDEVKELLGIDQDY